MRKDSLSGDIKVVSKRGFVSVQKKTKEAVGIFLNLWQL